MAVIHKRTSILAVLAVAGTLAAGAAQAGGVQWHIGINLPAPVVAYGPPAGYYAPPPPVVYAPPPPVYMAPPRVVYGPPPVAYYPPVQVAEREWCPPGQRHWRGRDDDRRGWRGGDRGDGRGYYGGNYGGNYGGRY